MQLLKDAGHTITYDWTRNEQNSRAQALMDLRGVVDADVFVGIFEKDLPYAGALVELGAALARGVPVYVLGNAPVIRRCIFFKHPGIQFGLHAFIRDILGIDNTPASGLSV